MQKIVPHLWFDKDAKAAAEFYTDLFGDEFGTSEITDVTFLHDTPSGTVDVVTMTLMGQEFMGIGAGPYFKVNPSISFLVACSTKANVDRLWTRLSDGGQVLMPLQAYPFSERYGWVQDRYGVSWQVIFFGEVPVTQTISPVLLFTGKVCGKAEEAIRFYASVFRNSSIGEIMRYEAGEGPDQEGTVKYAPFTLEGQSFSAMDSAHEHQFQFNEAISLLVYCDTQAEIDYYWDKLSADPASEQCGWLKDKYGVSWQIAPTLMRTVFQDKDPGKIQRVTQAFLKMKKFDIAALEKAAAG